MTAAPSTTPDRTVMSGAFSIYLDLIRFSAAAIVYISHFAFEAYSTNWLDGWRYYGPVAVMVFFVLSGFVIAYVYDTRKPSLKRFAIDRSARLYSVVIPALIITFLTDRIGMMFDSGAYYCCYDYGNLPRDTVISVLYLNEIWFAGLLPSNNVPYWSIGYEAWYYVLFAALMFAPRRWVPLAIIALCLFLGPLIVVLAPIWFLGVGAYYAVKHLDISLGQAWALVIGSVAAYLVFDLTETWWFLERFTLDWLGQDWVDRLRYSKSFLSDYILGPLFAIHFIGMAVICRHAKSVPNLVAAPIRYAASFTFSLYLFHWPLLKMYAIILDHDETSLSDQFILFPLVLVTIWVLGLVSERQKHRFRRAIEAIWNFVARAMTRKPAAS